MEGRIRRALDVLTQKHKNFVIYPFGKYGQMTRKILNDEYGIIENYVVDSNFKSTDVEVRRLEDLKTDYEHREFHILCVVNPDNWDITLEIVRNMGFASENRISYLLSRSPYFCPWNYFDEIRTLKRPKIATIECIAREIYRNSVDGAVAEGGVYQGKTARHINEFFPDRKIYLFDTFEGFNAKDLDADTSRDMYHMDIDFSNTSVEDVLGKMLHPNNVIIKKGWFPESASDVDDVFAFIRLDMDLYDPIYSGLNFFWDKMAPGGYIVVHDCRSENFDGARMALIDFCKEKSIGYYISPDKLGSAVICKGG